MSLYMYAHREDFSLKLLKENHPPSHRSLDFTAISDQLTCESRVVQCVAMVFFCVAIKVIDECVVSDDIGNCA